MVTIDGDRLVRTGTSRIVWPGTYGKLTVETGARVYLRSGQYRFDELHVAPNAELVVSAEAGWVRVFVSSELSWAGTVQGLGSSPAHLFLAYTGTSPTAAGGQFRGALVASSTKLTLQEGPHEGVFYGGSVEIAAGTQITHRPGPWSEVLPPTGLTPTAVIDHGAAGGSLVATNTQPATLSRPGGFDYTIPSRIPVETGNAGNHALTLEYWVSGVRRTCEFRGGASVSHPETLLELAKGREYGFVSCEDGSAPGTTHRVDSVRVSLEADGQALGGETRINIPADTSCSGRLPDPIAPGVSREMIESFAWPSADGDGGRVATRTLDGKPALYYANIYVRNDEDLGLVDRLLIHRMNKPMFRDEWPVDWFSKCGTIHYDHDGEGQWIFAVIPGVTYNRLLEVQHSSDFSSEVKALIPPVRLREAPLLATDPLHGSLSYAFLNALHFKYNHVSGAVATDAKLDAIRSLQRLTGYPSGVVESLSDVLEWVVEAVIDVVEEIEIFLGTLDSFLAGTTTIFLDTDVLNTDSRLGLRTPMSRVWGRNVAHEMAAAGSKVTMHMVSQRLWNLGAPAPTDFRGYLDGNGRVTLHVAKAGSDFWGGDVHFDGLCVELSNQASKVTSFLLAAELCDPKPTENDFGRFEQDSVLVQLRYDNWPLAVHTEITDSHKYMDEIVGDAPRQARVLFGHSAYALTGSNPEVTAWAGCFGYGDLAIDAAVTSIPVLATWVYPPSAMIAALASAYLAILAKADIVISEFGNAADSRGLPTHEYGHFAFCHLTRAHGAGELTDLMLTFDTIAAGQGNPDPHEEARVVNEAFADFFTAQVASGADYFVFPGGYPAGRGVDLSTAAPGLDSNLFSTETGEEAIGRLTTLLQDVFDGHPKLSHAPSNADGWSDATSSLGRVVPTQVRDDGDTDLEDVALGGGDLGLFTRFFVLRTSPHYRVESMEKAVADVLKARTNWCQKCLLMAPHFQSLDGADVRSHIEACLEGHLADVVEEPPSGILQRNAFTCEPCPFGEGMAADGTCTTCAADVTIDWLGQGRQCEEVIISPSTAPPRPNDDCPDTFVVDVLDNHPTYPVQSIVARPDTLWQSLDPQCPMTFLNGTVYGGDSVPHLTRRDQFSAFGQHVCLPSDLCHDTPCSFGDAEKINVAGAVTRVAVRSPPFPPRVTVSAVTEECIPPVR